MIFIRITRSQVAYKNLCWIEVFAVSQLKVQFPGFNFHFQQFRAGEFQEIHYPSILIDGFRMAVFLPNGLSRVLVKIVFSIVYLSKAFGLELPVSFVRIGFGQPFSEIRPAEAIVT